MIRTWITRVRARVTELPIWVGLPGAVGHAKLMRVAARIGLGESARFLRANRALLRRLVSRRFTPGPLIDHLAGAHVAGLVGLPGELIYQCCPGPGAPRSTPPTV